MTLKVSFCSDVEGDLEYFEQFVARSEALTWDVVASRRHRRHRRRHDHHDHHDHHDRSSQPRRALRLNDGYMFVYGGDVMDKHTGSLRFMHLLIQLKRTYPDRVELILGNRDINKMRFTSELTPEALDPSSRLSKTKPYWLNDDDDDDDDTLDIIPTALEYHEHQAQRDAKVNRIRWMLQYTMGADGDFERRRQELAELARIQGSSGGDDDDDDASEHRPDDDTVARSYEEMVRPGGLVFEYLHLGKLAVIIENALYLHGGVVREYKGQREFLIQCPSLLSPVCFHKPQQERALLKSDNTTMTMTTTTTTTRTTALIDWVTQLNAFKEDQLQEWIARPHYDAAFEHRGGEALIQYGVYHDMPSIVVGRQLTAQTNMPFELTLDQVDMFEQNGIRFLLSGHTPYGNAPTLIRQHQGRFYVVMADTSFSNTRDRGGAVSEVIVTRDHVRCAGVLPDQSEFRSTTEDPVIGTVLPNGEFVKGYRVHDPKVYMTFTVEGYAHSYFYHHPRGAKVSRCQGDE